jgi:hypothetical protein
MRLWLLKPRDDVLARARSPWRPPYDKTHAVVVRAASADEARHFAHDVSGNEGKGIYGMLGAVEDELAANVWFRPEYTECAPLKHAGKPGVIVRDRWEG